MNYRLLAYVIFAATSMTDLDMCQAQITESITPIDLPTPSAPYSSFFGTVGYILLRWEPITTSSSYILRVFKASNNMLELQINNIRTNDYNITGLEERTEYKITVAAVYETIIGQVESNQSDVMYFITGERCTGGRVPGGCIAHCTSTCDDPDPVCDRRCVAGCHCPFQLPLWKDGSCIAQFLCPPVKVTIKRPKNLRVMAAGAPGSVLLTWSPIEDVNSYSIRVLLNSNRSHVVHETIVDSTVAILAGLQEGVEYVFVVTSIVVHVTVPTRPPLQDGTQSRLLFPPTNVELTDITDTSFVARWPLQVDARRYRARLFASDQTTMLYENENLAKSTIVVENLAPGQRYFIDIAAAKYQDDFGIASQPVQAETLGVNVSPEEGYLSVIKITQLEPETTTTKPTTTTETTTQTLPQCVARYRELVALYAKTSDRNLPTDDLPAFPTCDSDGRFAATVCAESGACHCVDPDTGVKIDGSDFGGMDSQVRLNCDRYGTFDYTVEGLMVQEVTESFVVMKWKQSSQVLTNIIQLTQAGKTIRVSTTLQGSIATIYSLKPGTDYMVKVTPVNHREETGRSLELRFTTLTIEPPSNVFLNDTRHVNMKLHAYWTSSSNGQLYRIHLISCSDDAVLQSAEIQTKSITFDGLSPFLCYKVILSAVVLRYNPSTGTSVESKSAVVSGSANPLCQSRPLHVIFAIDASAKAGWAGFKRGKQMTQDIVMSLPEFGSSPAKVAVVRYYRTIETIFGLDMYGSPKKAVAAVRGIKYRGSPQVYRGKALQFIDRQFFSGTRNKGSDDPVSVVIFFASGSSTDPVTTSAMQLRSKAAVIAVGVGTEENETELDAISSHPAHSFSAGVARAAFEQARDAIVDLLCGSQ